MKISTTNLYFKLTFIFFLVYSTSFAQNNFKVLKENTSTKIKNQEQTGTCWSFSTISFLEAEMIRQGKPKLDLSEMYIVRNIYIQKAVNFVLRQGKANFSQGALNHDVLNAAAANGLMTEEAYSGLVEGQKTHNHKQLEDSLSKYVHALVKSKKPEKNWMENVVKIVDHFLGKPKSKFKYNNKSYTPQQFAKEYLKYNKEDYIALTSFSHHPFHSKFILEVPDNFSNGSFHNVTLDELNKALENSLNNGFTVAWDADVSEVGFLPKKGYAMLPSKGNNKEYNSKKEPKVTQETRQEEFLDYSTTDDHLMHITGIAEDENGKKFYLVKNSWGEIGKYKGFFYISQPYFLQKTISITFHKDALSKSLKEKLKL